MKIYNKILRSCIKRKYEILSLFNNDIKTINPYAFIRVYNEIETIEATLKTIVGGGITRGVLGYHLDEFGKDDGTSEVIKQFCKNNPNFIAFEYPYKVIPPSKTMYLNDIKEEYRLDTYYNFVLDKIPLNNWLIKIDCDHIYNEIALKKVLMQPKSIIDSIYLPALNMHYSDGKLYFLKNFYKIGDDHWLLLRNKDTNFCIDKDMGCEFLNYNFFNFIKAENIISLHFPLMKKSRIHLATKDNLIPYDEFDFSQLKMTEIDKEFILNKEKILSYFNS
ncbi:hypothetical protein AVBRAN12642_01325 [Campylobacter sp. RM12642]|uniref:hypothetical protein n=1 Tax=unclassified Campylobacter TaxID=2593542 RepID=UPI001DA6D5B9|nr:hypothetical protein [Campylobacter sp. RM12642]MBZ8007255.1 hypothetical protein [Campylobacter sp. RM9334]